MTPNERSNVLQAFAGEFRRLAALARGRAEAMLAALPHIGSWTQPTITEDAFSGTMAEWLQGKR